ncbi:MAG: CCA tRNA nucleotidyltransferase [Nanoarchaeota archaeon]|nr:CCA tRNA nucleotidyltransferase [Nanoarchaeota archaeon]MBU1632472.1 CCA tRNA nucleotidyltransferase [Nanoarchaeota archaeon]MBU1876455.1 CCA tRNA nucleotidyltransferase [Nanoarchaeota archaeon]
MKDILEIIKPSKKESDKVKSITSLFIKKLNSKLKYAEAILGGSGAKGTWLSGDHDIDIFVLFDYKRYSAKSDQLSEILEPILKKVFPKIKIEKVHGSRDYFKTTYQNFNLEIVPILKINKAEQAINITDISPLHSRWVNKHDKKIKNEIRLIKQFCKANNLYGAESYISGFSGYVLEILTINYGSFEALLKASQKWGNKEIVDPSKFYTKKTALFHINNSKLQSPIIIVDPVDKNRNAAAALSNEKYLLFRKLAKEYLKKPSKNLFQKEIINLDKLNREAEQKKQNIVFLQLDALKGKEDVVGSKLLKVFNHLERKLTQFDIKRSGWRWKENKEENEAIMFFLLAKKELPKFELRAGPPLKMKEFVKDFKKKNKDAFQENGKIYAKIKNKNPKLEDFMKNLIRDDYVKERVKKIKEVIIF